MSTLEQAFTIRSWEVDSRRRARLDVLFAFLLETAWIHAEQLGFGFSHLAAQNRLWVLSRFKLQLSTLPHWENSVTVRTWPRAARSVFAMREFQLLDDTGRVLGGATSAWLILDMASRRPQRSARILTTVPGLRTDLATDTEPAELPRMEMSGAPATVRACYSDIDVNCHVSSSRYLSWALDSYPMDFHMGNTPFLFEANFLGEVRSGEDLSIFTTEREPGMFVHTISRSGSGQEVSRIRLGWRAEVSG